MSRHTIALLPGDGIGPEVAAAARLVLEATGVPLAFLEGEIGWSCFESTGSALPPATLELVRTCDAALLGAVTSKPPDELDPEQRGFRSPIVGLRRALDLHTCVRPIRALRPEDGELDLVVVRENTEGLYAGLDFRPVSPALADALGLDERTRGDDVAITGRLVTRRAVRRVAYAAFAIARTRPRRHVTLAEKPNVMRATGGLFLEETRAVAAEHPDVTFAWENADAVCMRMVREPQRYDVLLAGNLFGDMLSDLGAGLAGGLGLLPSANLGDAAAVFEPAHGSAPDLAGTGRANPIAAILAAAMLLDHLGERAAADAVRRAVQGVVADGETLTEDQGGDASTITVARAIAAGVTLSENRLP